MEFSIESAREVLTRTPATLQAMLADLADEWIQTREADDAWSPYQVCGHLLHVEDTEAVGPWRAFLPVIDAP